MQKTGTEVAAETEQPAPLGETGLRSRPFRGRHRLFLHIYLGFVVVLVVFCVLVGIGAWVFDDEHDRRRGHDMASFVWLIEQALSGDSAGDNVEERLEALRERFDADLSLFDTQRRLLAHAGRELRPPPPDRTRSGWLRHGRDGPVFALHLNDGRWLVARRDKSRFFVVLVVLSLLAIAIGLGAYPLARRIAGRIERLDVRVRQLGAGDLSARVQVEGRDEVAALARSFNEAAERIEQLVDAQRSTLAAASHELRTPLARLRMAFELLESDGRPELRKQVESDIAELDDLIEELLLASRVQSGVANTRVAPVDVLALVAEEAARIGVEVSGEHVELLGEPRMIRRLIRNLLENARRYGEGSAIEAEVRRLEDGGVSIRVSDRGPGVSESERERIFEPFYRPPGSREEGRGAGLGLSLVRQIAHRHRGGVRYIARDGGGSCFEVELREPQATFGNT